MKKKILVTTAAFSLGLTSLGVTTTTFAAQNSPTTAQVQGQKQGVFPQTIGDKDGQLIFSQVGDTLKLESKNNGKSVSTKGNSWSIRVNGKEIFSFFETTKVEQVLQSFNQLPLEKKKGQQFEIVQKSREINRIGTSSGGRLIFSQTGDQLVVYAQNPDQNISNVNTEWKISVDGVEKHTFSETATAKDVKASIDKLKLKGQKFEIVKKSDEIRSAENDGVGKHNTPPITNLADTNNPTNPMKPAVQDQKKSVLPQTIGDKDGQLIFSQVGDTLKLESKNNGKSVSTKGNSWSIRVNGKEIFSFFETTKVEQVLQSFNQLPLEKKKGQQFEIVQKSREINRIGTSSGGRLIFSQTGDQLVVYAQNPDQKISNTNISWKISVDGVEKHTFSETATAKDVKASIDRLKLKGQNFEIVHKAGWLEIEGKKYHFNNDGEMQTGWLELDGKTYYINKHRIVKGTWYYFNSSGEMQTGWLELGGVKYYFNNDGAMRTGWLEFNGKKYHFNDNGAMQTGLKTIGKIAGTWYYFNSSGEMQTEWQTIDGKTYYFDYDGVAKKGWQTIEGKTYYFKYGSGEMATAWENIFGAWYYFNNDGAKQTGWQQIDGKKYYLDIHGIWQEGADWDKQAPLNLTYTSSATANDIQLDENKNAVIDLSFNLAGYIDDYNTYEKPMRYIEIELPEGVTFAGEENTLSADKLKVYVYRKGWHFGSWSNYYNIAVEMKKDSNSGKIWVSKDPLNYYYIHAYANNIKVNVDTSVYKEDTLTFKIGGNTLTTGQKIPRG